MSLCIEVLLSPTEYQNRARQGFAGDLCVVFDVLRATSVMITGLANGAAGFVPVAEIPEALAQRALSENTLLAGEREGLRILSHQSGGLDFDFGNSPREFTPSRVKGRRIAITTTNGTRAMQACREAQAVVLGSFLNLAATTRWALQQPCRRIVLVCAGTGHELAFEDVLGAGALCDLVKQSKVACDFDDAALLAYHAYLADAGNLATVIATTKNGRRLSANAELKDDVEWCMRRDVYDFVGGRGTDGVIRRLA